MQGAGEGHSKGGSDCGLRLGGGEEGGPTGYAPQPMPARLRLLGPAQCAAGALRTSRHIHCTIVASQMAS